jgi:hypothetical protein
MYLDCGRRTTQLIRKSLGRVGVSHMKQVLSTTDRSLVEGLRVAAERDGITLVVNNDNVNLPSSPITVAVADDATYPRALALLRQLQSTTPAVVQLRSWPSQLLRIAILLAIAAAIVFLVERLSG